MGKMERLTSVGEGFRPKRELIPLRLLVIIVDQQGIPFFGFFSYKHGS